ncbi:hypothetical protein ACQEUU_29920 [Nonomuraea sp. CA-218870]|uniref:hypothetical protein n=1 Tax=Nonomuraea sp. CA-218870 TaxID=3239998 RepID=UPI003D929CEB
MPDSARRRFNRWCRAAGYDIHRQLKLNGGRSGAEVYVVHRSDPEGSSRQLVLKFSAEGSEEIRRIRHAVVLSPASFVSRHLVGVGRDFVRLTGGWWAIFNLVAGDDLDNSRTLAVLLGEPNAAEICGRVVASILGDWNERVEIREETVSDHLRGILGRKLLPNSELHRWVRENGRLSAAVEPVTEGRGEPSDPLELLTSGHREPILSGNAHGDLNVRNVLVPGTPAEAERYQLIDYGDFSPDAPLARDPMHLLLSLAAEWLSGGMSDSTDYWALIPVIVTPGIARIPPHLEAHRKISAAVHDAGRTWARTHGWESAWATQSLLSLVACGLLFAGRNLDHLARIGLPNPRNWFFEVASMATRELRGHCPRAFERTAPPASAFTRDGRGTDRSPDRARLEARVTARLRDLLPPSQQRMGNLGTLARLMSWVLHEDEELYAAVPCRYRSSQQGAALFIASDRSLHIAEMEGYDVAVSTVIEYRSITDLGITSGRRLYLFPGRTIEIHAGLDVYRVKDIIPWQGEAMLATIRESHDNYKLRNGGQD